MKLTTAQKSLGITASLLGIVQSPAWFVMSLLCIIEFNKGSVPESQNSYQDYFNYQVYVRFLYKDTVLPDHTIVTPTSFTIFMWFYLFLDIIWFVVSIYQIYAIKKTKSNLVRTLNSWGVITYMISCVDLVLVILIGFDFDENCIMAYEDSNMQISVNCTDNMIPVLIIAAKGFILWLVNVIFAVIVFAIARVAKRAPPESEEPYVDNKTIPRAILQRETSLYNQQLKNITDPQNSWTVNVRTAFTTRTPPATPSYTNPPNFFSRTIRST